MTDTQGSDAMLAARGRVKARCDQCRFWRKGYRLQGFKVPSWCDRHFHSQPGDDMCCAQFDDIDCGFGPDGQREGER